MIVKNIFPEGEGNSLDIMAMAVLAVLAVVSILGKRIKKQEISPVVLIIIAGVAGSLLYGV